MAIAHLKRSLSINPADSDAHYQLGSALLKAGKPKDAVPEFRTAVLFVPTDWCEPYDAMAAAYTALKDEGRAEVTPWRWPSSARATPMGRRRR